MIKILNRYTVHEDPRGRLEGLINFGEWREINMISSKPHVKRGNHYHKETLELFIILDGELEVVCQKVADGKVSGNVQRFDFKSGDVFVIEPFTNHIFTTKTEARWMNALSKPLDQKNPDFHRPIE